MRFLIIILFILIESIRLIRLRQQMQSKYDSPINKIKGKIASLQNIIPALNEKIDKAKLKIKNLKVEKNLFTSELSVSIENINKEIEMKQYYSLFNNDEV